MKVLEVFREPFAFGGQESYIMNMFRPMDHERIHIDFLTPFEASNKAYVAELEKAGSHVFHYDYPFGTKNNQAFKKSLNDFLSRHQGEYDLIHFHSGSAYALMMGPKIAKDYNIPIRVVHSHSCGFESLKHQLIKKISAPYFKAYPTHYAACSKLAGAWKYPDSIVNDELVVFKNAVDLERFDYDEKIRERLRKEFDVENKVVLGHIGRFSTQKNHEFLIRLFKTYSEQNDRAVLWLIGVGELQEPIRELVRTLDLEDKVVFFNLRDDVDQLLNAMDVFLLPSFFEGLPVVGIEAQATGLPVICSDLVARELPIDELSWFLSLEDQKPWLEQIDAALKIKRQNQKERMKEMGYEVVDASRKLEQFYLDAYEKLQPE